MSSFAEKQRKMKEIAVQKVIYEATIRLISETNPENLKMQAIADAAGIATGTLYNYFKNKLELLYFVDRQLHSLILNQFKEIADSSDLPVDKLKKMIREVLGFCREYHGVFYLSERFGVKDHIPKEEKHDNLSDAYDCLKRILDEGVAQGQFCQVNTELTAKLFFSTIIGVIEVHDWLQDYEMTKKDDELADFFLSYLTRP